MTTGLSALSATSSGGVVTIENNRVRCDVTELQRGEQCTLTIMARAANTGVLTNTATVSSLSTDSYLINNAESDDVIINGQLSTDLELIRHEMPPTVMMNTLSSYALKVKNRGVQWAKNVTITESIPAQIKMLWTSGQDTIHADADVTACGRRRRVVRLHMCDRRSG